MCPKNGNPWAADRHIWTSATTLLPWVNKPLPDSLPKYREVWSELNKRAADKGVKIAFENCAMDGNWQTGDWNIAHNPDAWELMFNATPDDNIGLEWEPCHQLVYLIDPLPQIRKWGKKFFHVHGKDATVRWEVIREHGIFGKEKFVFMRTPGFGDSNWTDIISELRLAGYEGAIDIEGWHDPVYRGDLEMTGQVRALNYLKDAAAATSSTLRGDRHGGTSVAARKPAPSLRE